MNNQELRKWCLDRAFQTRDLAKVPLMAVTNVAEDYYLWITQGESQGNRLERCLKQSKLHRRVQIWCVKGSAPPHTSSRWAKLSHLVILYLHYLWHRLAPSERRIQPLYAPQGHINKAS